MTFKDVNFDTYFHNYPDKDGYFGKYGGVFIEDKLKKAMEEITPHISPSASPANLSPSCAESAKSFRADPLPLPILSA